MKPTPARMPESAASAAPKPVSARESMAEGREGGAGDPPSLAAGDSNVSDVAEIALEKDGTTWTIRVLGRSGRAGDRVPPLVLLGFWRGTPEDRDHELEATVVARSLGEIPTFRLESALAEAAEPPPQGAKKPFFEAAGQGRRGGGSRREGREA